MSNFSRFVGWLKARSGNCAPGNHVVNGPGDLVRLIREIHGNRVLCGPFQGLIYGDTSFGSTHLPKLLGTYEKELSGLFAAENLRCYDTFINLGCAEGYYTNGIGHALKKRAGQKMARVTGIDLNTAALAESKRISALNGLQVEVSPGFDFITGSGGPGRTLIICDVEGAETDLLQPSRLPALHRTDFIIEIHDSAGQNSILEELQRRFSATHESSVILSRPREPQDFPADLQVGLNDEIKLEAMNERRVKGLRWLNLKSKEP